MPLQTGITKLTESGDTILEWLNQAPDAIERGGLKKILENNGCVLVESRNTNLTDEESKQYGAWNRLGLASRHLADIVNDQLRRGLFTIGLLPTCNGLMGMLGGFQRSGSDAKLLKVGVIWFDAHGDINTPETTPSGLLAGMPVAIATGMCLDRLRVSCGQTDAIPTDHIIMAGVRDLDPLERETLDNCDIEQITSDEIRGLTPIISQQLNRLGEIADIIYVHVDIDVLDPTEIPGLGLPVKGGPTVRQLGSVLRSICQNPKVGGLGVASYPVGGDPRGIALNAVYDLIRNSVVGASARGT